jgi:two-component system nitrate/nitrite response regulator NarL
VSTFSSSLRPSGSEADADSTETTHLSSMRILIVAEARVHREALARALVSHGEGLLVTATQPDETLAMVSAVKPHVGVFDVTPEAGLALLEEVRKRTYDLRSVVIGEPDNEADVVAWVRAGVAGYVTTADSLDDLITAIAAVTHGETAYSSGIPPVLLRRIATLASAGAAASLATLTARETQVADLLTEGLSNKEIALSLSIALPTVKAHVHNILSKLNARRRGEAVARMHAPAMFAPSLLELREGVRGHQKSDRGRIGRKD